MNRETNPTDEQLDGLLDLWNQAISAPMNEDAHQGLVAEIVSSIEGPLLECPAAETQADGSTASFGWAGVFVACLAATIFIVVGLQYFPSSTDSRIEAYPASPKFAALNPVVLQSSRELLQSYDDLFGNRFIGAVEYAMADRGTQVDLQLEQDSSRTMGIADSAALVRLSCGRRRVGQADWEYLWSCDIVARNERWIQSQVSGFGSGQVELDLWTYRLPDGQLYVDVCASPGAESKSKRWNRSMLANEDSLPVFCSNEGDVETCIFQSSAVLTSGSMQ